MPQIIFLREHKDAFHGRGAVITTYKECQEVEASDDWIKNLRTHPDHKKLFRFVKEEVAPLTASDIEAITLEQIAAMNRNDVMALEVEGLQAMTTDQLSAIRVGEIGTLKKGQAALIAERLKTTK